MLFYILAFSFQGALIPVEVKSGSAGRLRSLQLFMDLAPHNIAVRLYGGHFRIDEVKTLRGKKYRLLSLPHFLVGKVQEYLMKFIG